MLLQILTIYKDTGHQEILSSIFSRCFSGYLPSIWTLVIKKSYPPSSQAASPDIHHLFGHWSSSNLILHLLQDASPDIYHLFGHWSSSNLILYLLKLLLLIFTIYSDTGHQAILSSISSKMLLRIFTDVHHPNLS
ncbi:hypothetical protein RRG08_019142 [Elysia crispata]|uniref:Uncharacterized protein n=1 Tax=Elysia crispata TaxID=231223 RepID=A0AAE0ZCQ8_9GAST|nr:hypothetical protein RRG08_019142 [Elysia crispata]